MESVFRDPKTPSTWVELDFHARRRRFKQLKRRLIVGALFVCVLGVGASIASSLVLKRTATWYQSAPLSSGHALFNDDCSKCHTLEFQTAKRFWPGNASHHTVDDGKCQACHPTVLDHHGTVVAQPACVTCHREHRGREQLIKVTDDHCRSCHADLKTHFKDTRYADVSSFPNKHPEFALWEKRGTVTIADKRKADGTRVYREVPLQGDTDPGLIRFNHKRHLGLDEPLLNGRKRPECVDCHQPDDTKRAMKPISHEEHCARCHGQERSFLLAGTFQGEDLKRKVTEFARTPLPHTDPRTIRDVLDGRLRRFVHIDEQHIMELADVSELDRPWVRDKIKQNWKSVPYEGRPPFYKLLQFVEPQLIHGERLLYDSGTATGCGKCHDLTKDGAEATRGAAARWQETKRPEAQLPDYARPQLPARWLVHAQFSHAAHGQLSCTACHDVANSTKTSDILLPKLAACASCHSPTAPNGGARHGCVDCHNFHEHSNVNVQRFNTIEEALRGK